MTIAIVCTARPSYSRLKTVIQALQQTPDLDVQVIAAGSALLPHYGRVVDQMRADGIPVTEECWSVVEGTTPEATAKGTGYLLAELAATFRRLAPECVVVHADRHEVLAAAMAAAYQGIPLVHLQGGEVTGSIDDKVRHAITQLADVHCVSTAEAGQFVQKMQPGAEVYVTGCPSLDLLQNVTPDRSYDVVVLQHPVLGEDFPTQIQATIDAIEQTSGRVLWIWPGHDAQSDAGAAVLRHYEQSHPGAVTLRRHVAEPEFAAILAGAECVVGNSSAGIRECGWFGTPVVDIGSRQAGRTAGPNVLHVDPHAPTIAEAISLQRTERYPAWHHYGNGHSGASIAQILVTRVLRMAVCA